MYEGERTSGQQTLTVIGLVLLVLSVMLCVAVTWASLAFAHQATCGPTPPVEYRHHILIVGLVGYAAFAAVSAVLLVKGGTNRLVFAMICAVGAMGWPSICYLFALVSSAMC